MRVVKHWKRFPGSSGRLVSGIAQEKLGLDFEQPGLMESVPAHLRGFGTR